MNRLKETLRVCVRVRNLTNIHDIFDLTVTINNNNREFQCSRCIVNNKAIQHGNIKTNAYKKENKVQNENMQSTKYAPFQSAQTHSFRLQSNPLVHISLCLFIFLTSSAFTFI